MNRSEVIVLDPELEIWIPVQSPHFVEVFANGEQNLVNQVLSKHTLNALGKPLCPKELVEEVCRLSRVPRSSALYGQLASKVSLTSCQDRAFVRLKQTLQMWFPP